MAGSQGNIEEKECYSAEHGVKVQNTVLQCRTECYIAGTGCKITGTDCYMIELKCKSEGTTCYNTGQDCYIRRTILQ